MFFNSWSVNHLQNFPFPSTLFMGLHSHANLPCSVNLAPSSINTTTQLGLTDLVIVNVFECVADHADAHVDKVRRSHLEHLLGKLLSVFVDLLKNKHKTHHDEVNTLCRGLKVQILNTRSSFTAVCDVAECRTFARWAFSLRTCLFTSTVR